MTTRKPRPLPCSDVPAGAEALLADSPPGSELVCPMMPLPMSKPVPATFTEGGSEQSPAAPPATATKDTPMSLHRLMTGDATSAATFSQRCVKAGADPAQLMLYSEGTPDEVRAAAAMLTEEDLKVCHSMQLDCVAFAEARKAEQTRGQGPSAA